MKTDYREQELKLLGMSSTALAAFGEAQPGCHDNAIGMLRAWMDWSVKRTNLTDEQYEALRTLYNFIKDEAKVYRIDLRVATDIIHALLEEEKETREEEVVG